MADAAAIEAIRQAHDYRTVHLLPGVMAEAAEVTAAAGGAGVNQLLCPTERMTEICDLARALGLSVRRVAPHLIHPHPEVVVLPRGAGVHGGTGVSPVRS